MSSFFGTDGIRRQSGFFTESFLDNFAKAVSQLPGCGKVALARDTRPSGVFMEKQLLKSLSRYGITVLSFGIIPSPCLAYCTTATECDYGLMLSASHNPPSYNGIKLFLRDGSKATTFEENLIENFLDSPFYIKEKQSETAPCDGKKLYLESLSAAPDLKGLKILLDCAFGAAGELAESVFRMLGAKVVSIRNDLNSGEKINSDCGAEHISNLLPLAAEFDAAFAFDGDADRVKAVADNKIFDGDTIMYSAARILHLQNKLNKNSVCGTVMTNSGVEKAYSGHGIKLLRADVGDRAVFSLMNECGLNLGGEKSGHIIFSDVLNTGDGIMTAVIFASVLKNFPLYEVCDVKEIPSVSAQLRVNEKEAQNFISAAGKGIFRYDGDARIVIRASGTEPVIRFLVEHEDAVEAKLKLDFLIKAVSEMIK